MGNLPRKIGLLGGTFDPPHYGHLWLAEIAREILQLDTVLFLPVGIPPHKLGYQITDAFHRQKMVELSIAGNDHFLIDTRDIQRVPPHTTASLLPLLKHSYPDAQLWLLIGSDSLCDLPSWADPERVVALCRLAVLPREGHVADLQELDALVPGIAAAVDFLDGPKLTISSTELRSRAMAGRTMRYLLPAPVIDYIRTSRLYR